MMDNKAKPVIKEELKAHRERVEALKELSGFRVELMNAEHDVLKLMQERFAMAGYATTVRDCLFYALMEVDKGVKAGIAKGGELSLKRPR